MTEVDAGVSSESAAVAAPEVVVPEAVPEVAPVVAAESVVIEAEAAARVTDKLPEQFSATPPHSQAAPALRPRRAPCAARLSARETVIHLRPLTKALSIAQATASRIRVIA